MLMIAENNSNLLQNLWHFPEVKCWPAILNYMFLCVCVYVCVLKGCTFRSENKMSYLRATVPDV